MKKFLLALLFCAPLFITAAFADEEAAVVEVVREFFDAMTARDVARSSALMTPDGILYGYRETEAGLQIVRPTHASYLEGLASRENELIERFWDPKVLLHDRMAVVWTPYDLYVDGEFSHCGIDSFSLLKTEEGWKISGIVFSMEAENCAPSPLGPLQQPR
jgi:putative lumazine-binding protein